MSERSERDLLRTLSFGAIGIFAIAAIATCSPRQETVQPAEQAQDAPVAKERFPSGAIERAKADLLAREDILDIVYDGGAFGVEWHLGVLANTPQFALAFEVCRDLQERGLVDEDVDVRIINVGELELNGGDFHRASLGRVNCWTSERRRI